MWVEICHYGSPKSCQWVRTIKWRRFITTRWYCGCARGTRFLLLELPPLPIFSKLSGRRFEFFNRGENRDWNWSLLYGRQWDWWLRWRVQIWVLTLWLLRTRLWRLRFVLVSPCCCCCCCWEVSCWTWLFCCNCYSWRRHLFAPYLSSSTIANQNSALFEWMYISSLFVSKLNCLPPAFFEISLRSIYFFIKVHFQAK